LNNLKIYPTRVCSSCLDKTIKKARLIHRKIKIDLEKSPLTRNEKTMQDRINIETALMLLANSSIGTAKKYL
jgi:hypothetical protein